MLCRVVRARIVKVIGHDFLVMPGAERMRNALSTQCQCLISGVLVTSHGHTFIPTLVHQLHHHVYLVHSSAIEVLAHIRCQLILAYTSLVFPSSHCGRLSSDARIDQQRLIERRCERSRR